MKGRVPIPGMCACYACLEVRTLLEVSDIIALRKVLSQFTGSRNIFKMQPENAFLFVATFKSAMRVDFAYLLPTMPCVLLLPLFEPNFIDRKLVFTDNTNFTSF